MSLTKFKKLDSRGVAHFVVPLVIITLVAVAGTYFLVASHASSIKPPKIVSTSYTAPSSVPGHWVGKAWCGDVMISYRAKTSGKVDTVNVDVGKVGYEPTSQASPLTHVGNSAWTGKAAVKEICALKKGGKAKLQVYISFTAKFGQAHDTVYINSGRAISKSVKIN